MNIKQTADASGVSARNIRYYEQAGLLAPARNPENDYRIYTDADVRTLKLIRVLRTLDMPVEDIRAVLSGTLPLTEAAERQRRQLEAEQQKLFAAVPDLAGRGLGYAKTVLSEAGFHAAVQGSGGTVLRQYPADGVSARRGSTVTLYTEEDCIPED